MDSAIVTSISEQEDGEEAAPTPGSSAAKVAGRLFLNAAGNSKDARRVLAQLKEQVAFLSENDARNTPKITDIDELTQKLKTLSEEIEVRVNELSESSRAADNGVEELSALWRERSDVEKSKWRVHENALQLKDEKFESEIAACLHSRDLEVERGRVDSRVNALRSDLESSTAENNHLLREMLAAEIGKVITRIGGIQASFDAALGVVGGRVDHINSEFATHKEDLHKEKEDKGTIVKDMNEARERQNRTKELLNKVREKMTTVSGRHGEDITILQQDMAAALSGIASLDERLTQHVAASDESFSSIGKRIDNLQDEIERRLERESKLSKQHTEAALAKLQGQLMGVFHSGAEASNESEKKLQTATSLLSSQLSDQNEAHLKSIQNLSERIDDANSALEAAQESNSLALAAARDDTMRNLERASEELTRDLLDSTGAKLSELADEHAGKLSIITEEVQAAKAAAQRGLQGLEDLESRVKSHKEDAESLGASFRAAEEAKLQWQQRVNSANSSFRAELDSYLQQVEELLNERLDSSRADVSRLGRSNVALSTIVNQTRSRLSLLASSDSAAATTAKLDMLADKMAETIRVEEAHASVDKPFLLSKQFQAYLSSEVQIISSLLAHLADNATVRQVIVHVGLTDKAFN